MAKMKLKKEETIKVLETLLEQVKKDNVSVSSFYLANDDMEFVAPDGTVHAAVTGEKYIELTLSSEDWCNINEVVERMYGEGVSR